MRHFQNPCSHLAHTISKRSANIAAKRIVMLDHDGAFPDDPAFSHSSSHNLKSLNKYTALSFIMNYIASSISKPRPKPSWMSLPTIQEEPSWFHMVNKYQRKNPRSKKQSFYQGVVNDLKNSGAVEPEAILAVSALYAKTIAEDHVRTMNQSSLSNDNKDYHDVALN